MSILDNVSALCKERGLSIAALEDGAGLTPKSIGKWNKSLPSVDKAAKAAAFLGVPISRLLDGTDLQTEKAAAQKMAAFYAAAKNANENANESKKS